MKTEELILAAAVAFAGVLVIQKTGVLKRIMPHATAPLLGFVPGRAPYRPGFGGGEQGFNPADPGAYLSVDELIAGATDGDTGYIPTFDQTIDAVLGRVGTAPPMLASEFGWAR